MKYKQIQ